MFKTINWNTGAAAERFRKHHLKKIKEKKKKRNKAASSQAGGPAHNESGFKQLRLTSDKLIRYYRIHK